MNFRQTIPIFCLSLLGILCLAAGAGAPPATTQTMPPARKAAVVVLEGQIDNYSRDQMFKRFAEARRTGATAIILQINTPGGLVSAAMEMSRFLKQQNDLHITALVQEKALSAGAMISLACNEIVMEPNALLGDCAPIARNSGGGLETLGTTERAKMESPILEDFYESSLRNGYDPLLTQSMVAMGRVVHWVQKSGERRFVNEADYGRLTGEGWQTVPGVRNPLDSADTLLTVHSDLALKIGLAKAIVADPQALAAARNWTIVTTLRPGTGEFVIQLLNNPAARGLLIFLFLQTLWISLTHPGHGMPEVFATVSLGLLVGVPLLTGYAQWWEVLMIFGGLALLALELLVIPGFGITGISGIVLLLVGMIFTFAGKEPATPGWLPQLEGTYDGLQRGLFFVTGGLGCTLLLSFWLRSYLPRLPILNRLILTEVTGQTVPIGFETSEGRWPGVGVKGVAVTDLRPSGSAQFLDLASNDQRVVSVISDSGFVVRGTEVTVIEVSGNRVAVRV